MCAEYRELRELRLPSAAMQNMKPRMLEPTAFWGLEAAEW